ncbi:hypothetical protein KXD40_008848 [Peronospora effusa]|uniref:Uncharacterized protein n=1 Tax=Peronospora effusa TaxID=542832 RepID=A0A3M6VQL4_9STRA|nr:hypothetical protein DD238_005024 [Peronospora effusa]RQM16742.1 hypothetical protein DD237_000541 [Peronospora effusa]UIZ21856.1 hypothetical protein KXD40_008848 [Peronospora effusa]
MSRMKIRSTPTTPISFNVADAEASRAKLVDHFNALAKGKNLDQFLEDGFFKWGKALTKHNKDYTTASNKQYEAPTVIKLLQDLYGDKLIMEKVNRDKRYRTLGTALVREWFNQRKHLDDVKMLEKVMEEEGKVKETGKEVEKKIEWAALYEKKDHERKS